MHCICDTQSVTESCPFAVRECKSLAEMVSDIQFLFVWQRNGSACDHCCILAFSYRGAVNFILIFSHFLCNTCIQNKIP